MFNFINRKPIIEFVSADPIYSALIKPDNSRKFFPDWVKRMKEQTSENQHPDKRKMDTVRKCVPFLDAMRLGYMITCPADVYVSVNGNSIDTEVRTQLNFGTGQTEMISGHNIEQMSPDSPYRGTILKFNNPWKINTRPGYSCLFIDPINRGKNRYFECFSGVVDTDNYQNIINFPFRILNPKNEDKYEFYIKKGEPIIQVIPFKRTDAYGKPQVRMAKRHNDPKQDEWAYELRDGDDIAGNFSWYREHQVEKKITLEK